MIDSLCTVLFKSRLGRAFELISRLEQDARSSKGLVSLPRHAVNTTLGASKGLGEGDLPGTDEGKVRVCRKGDEEGFNESGDRASKRGADMSATHTRRIS